MSDVCNNVLESCICVMYIRVVVICFFVGQQNTKLHIQVVIFVVSVVSLLRWNM